MWRPILIFIANFVAGWLLTRGYINPADHNAVATSIADGLGYFILAVTSVASIIHAFKHPHGMQPSSPVASTSTTTQTKTEQVFTADVSQTPGTPPPPTLPSSGQ